jgi:molybdopterin molybdotransferase
VGDLTGDVLSGAHRRQRVAIQSSQMTTAAQTAGVLSFDQAYERVRRYAADVPTPATESVRLLESLGRVAAHAIVADRDFPPFARSTRDGYAVRAAATSSLPVALDVVGQIKAGGTFDGTINSGEAVEIMTGAALPEGADAVVMVEYTSAQQNGLVRVERTVVAGENVVPRGAEAIQAQELLPAGTRMAPAQIAMAAGAGYSSVQVFRRARVAVLATGDELVDVAQIPEPHQIRNSNSYSLAAQVISTGGEPLILPAAPDEEKKLEVLVHAALASADLLLLSGGVSMGKFDLVEYVLKNLGAEFFFTGTLIQPGKPLVFGEITQSGRKVPFFGLPGNPVSVMVTFDLFVRPVLSALNGAAPERHPVAQARLRKDVKTKTGLTRFLPALLRGGLDNPEVELVAWHGSGDLAASSRANCYLVVPPDRELLSAGDTVSILLR